MKCIIPAKIRRSCRGATMLESILAMLLIFLILFGLLQIFYIAAGQMFTDYAALRGARSKCVGFIDYLSNREARINAIGASGPMVYPQATTSFGGMMNQFAAEKVMIEDYAVGDRWLEYEFWYSGSEGSADSSASKTEFSVSSGLGGGDLITTNTMFSDYSVPENFPLRTAFFKDNLDIRGSASLANYALQFLNQ